MGVIVVAWGGVWRKDKKDKLQRGTRRPCECDKHVHYIDGVDGFMGVYIKMYQVVLIKYI